MKKAWELQYDLYHDAEPVVLSEEEQAWSGVEKFETMANTLYGMKWESQVPGSGAPEKVIVGAVSSMENMGYDITDAERLMHEGLRAHERDDTPTLIKKTCALWNLFGNMEKNEDHPYHEYTVYDDLDAYLKSVSFPEKVRVDTSDESFRKAIRAGWIAQFVGGAFGTAMEGYTKEQLRKKFGEVWDYVREPNTYNDDVTYEIAFLNAFYTHGYGVTSRDIGLEWVALVPFGWSAEEIALKNLEAGIFPPESGYFNNPYREWIGAQMRAAICGMVAPGDPKTAASLAFRDGVVSHHNNGVLGEVFNAVMVAMAFTESDVRTIVESAIRMIPADSEYRKVLNQAYDACQNHSDWEEAWDAVDPSFKKYNWIHAYPNAAAEVIALWFGNGDFNLTLHIIGMIGYDVDCNAAQIMTVIGIIDKQVDDQWKKPLGNDIRTYCRRYKEMTFDSLTDWTISAIRKHE